MPKRDKGIKRNWKLEIGKRDTGKWVIGKGRKPETGKWEIGNRKRENGKREGNWNMGKWEMGKVEKRLGLLANGNWKVGL